jgi:hypothetical protein
MKHTTYLSITREKVFFPESRKKGTGGTTNGYNGIAPISMRYVQWVGTCSALASSPLLVSSAAAIIDSTSSHWENSRHLGAPAVNPPTEESNGLPLGVLRSHSHMYSFT